MSFIIGVLTFLLIINCLVLILLVLIQLPKKDAGAGIAFGAGTADALFGAGSGNILTKITKYATTALLVLSLVIGYIQTQSTGSSSNFEKMVGQKQMQNPNTQPANQNASAPARQTAPTPISGATQATTNMGPAK